MSTIGMAAILTASILAICRLFIVIEKKQKRKLMNGYLLRFRDLVSRHNLSLSAQEVLKGCIMGLDGIHRKLLVLDTSGEGPKEEIIDLSEIKTCSVLKHYGMIRGGELKKHELDQYLEKISLHFERNEGKPNVDIPFYQRHYHAASQLPELEQRARHWEAILSKMLHGSEKKIA